MLHLKRISALLTGFLSCVTASRRLRLPSRNSFNNVSNTIEQLCHDNTFVLLARLSSVGYFVPWHCPLSFVFKETVLVFNGLLFFIIIIAPTTLFTTSQYLHHELVLVCSWSFDFFFSCFHELLQPPGSDLWWSFKRSKRCEDFIQGLRTCRHASGLFLF